MPDLNATITIKATSEGVPGILVSMRTRGNYSDEMFSRRFYSIDTMPPDDLDPLVFWGSLLRSVSDFLLTGHAWTDDHAQG